MLLTCISDIYDIDWYVPNMSFKSAQKWKKKNIVKFIVILLMQAEGEVSAMDSS